MTSAEGPVEPPATGREGAGDGEPGTEGACETGVDGGTSTGRPPVLRPGARGGSVLDFDDPLDRPSVDDSDRGWGDSFSAADDDFMRFLNEKPPHHI